MYETYDEKYARTKDRIARVRGTRMNTKLNKATKYSGNYKGINFLISLHGVDDTYRPDGTWCYYLLINEKQLPDEYRKDFILEPVFDDKGRLSHDYYATNIADLDWHCGITYYSKEGGADGEPITVKIGCDYAHYWDEGKFFDVDIVLNDVKGSIDKLYALYPKIKICSSLYGGYFSIDEGEFNKHGNFVSFSEKEQWDIDYPKKVSQ
jgi:hypothetical protein